jgi:WD40 repeat protein
MFQREVFRRISGHCKILFDNVELLKRMIGHKGWVKGVAWDPMGKYLASQVKEPNKKLLLTLPHLLYDNIREMIRQ